MSPREKRETSAGTTVSGTLGALGAHTGKGGPKSRSWDQQTGKSKVEKGHNEEPNKQDRTPTETDKTRRTAPESR